MLGILIVLDISLHTWVYCLISPPKSQSLDEDWKVASNTSVFIGAKTLLMNGEMNIKSKPVPKYQISHGNGLFWMYLYFSISKNRTTNYRV